MKVYIAKIRVIDSKKIFINQNQGKYGDDNRIL